MSNLKINAVIEQNKALDKGIEEALEDMDALMMYLQSDKFCGRGNNFVNASEICDLIGHMRNKLTVSLEQPWGV